MSFLENLFINILSMSTIASALMIIILVIRNFLKNKISLSKLSLLWIIFIIVLIFPINFSSRLSIKNYINIDNDEKIILDISNSYSLEEKQDVNIKEVNNNSR